MTAVWVCLWILSPGVCTSVVENGRNRHHESCLMDPKKTMIRLGLPSELISLFFSSPSLEKMPSSAAFEKEIESIQPSPVASSETSSELDDTYEVHKKNEGLGVDPVQARKVVRKIDLRIVPILFFTYLLQYLDKNGINYASAFGLEKGTNLKGQDYSWLGQRHRGNLRLKTLIMLRLHILFWISCWPTALRVLASAPPYRQISWICNPW